MEKNSVPPRPAARPMARRWERALAAGLLMLVAVGVVPRLSRWPAVSVSWQDSTDGFSWQTIPPSRKLRWHPCYDGFDCARMDVPMDWQHPSDGQRVVLAVIRRPATNRTHYLGPVFFNPGGPGGSGVWSMRNHGQRLQEIVGTNHDIVSFDTRGVGASVPRIACWDSVQKEHVWDLQTEEGGIVDAYPGAVYDAYARSGAVSRQCEATAGGSGSGLLAHVNTVVHARDLLALLDASHALGDGDGQLRYWGFSYGTVLGGVFAAQYPDRVARLLSDGNVDYREWHDHPYVSFLRDTDKVLDAFFALCHRAGPAVCALYEPSPAAIEARLDRLLAALRKSPVLVAADTVLDGVGPPHQAPYYATALPELITYSKLRRLLSATLYQPRKAFPRFARIAAALERRDGRPFAALLAAGRLRGGRTLQAVCTAENTPPTEPLTGVAESNRAAFPAIMCADGFGHAPGVASPDAFAAHAAELLALSRAAGAVNALFPLACVGRTVAPAWPLTGPVGAPATAHPLLFLNNWADNVTPLVSARNNSAAFPGSGLLVQRGYGHTSLASPSTCVARFVRDYFQNGTLPPPDAVCDPDILPFDLPVEGVSPDASDAALTAAVHALHQQAEPLMLFQ